MPIWLMTLIAACLGMLIGAWFQRQYDIAERKIDAQIAATHDPRCISRDPVEPYRDLCDCHIFAIIDDDHRNEQRRVCTCWRLRSGGSHGRGCALHVEADL